MRRAPRSRFRLLITAFVACGALFLGAVAFAAGTVDSGGEANDLAAENARLGDLENGALLELYAAQTRLGRAERQVSTLQARAAALDREETAARDRLALARRANATAQAQLGDRLRALYIEGDADPLEILFGVSSLDDVLSALDGLERLAAEDERIVGQVERAQADLETALGEVEREQESLQGVLASATEARAALAAARDRQAAYVESLRHERALNDAQIESLTVAAQAAEERSAEIEAAAPAPAAGTTSVDASAAPLVESRTGEGRQLTVDAVAYSLPGHTANGLPVGKGVVAVDPRVIPLGTRMYVPGYGPAIAADVGSAIIGNIIDLWFPTYEQAAAWGRKTVTITIYD